jgi:hypothetical protein
MYWLLEAPLQHGKGPCNNYASYTATVDGKGYIFSEGLHFSSFGKTG